jgi:transposase
MGRNAINERFRRLVPKLREKGFYKSQNQRKIDWHKYNIAQTEEAVRLVDRMNVLVDTCKVEKINILGRKGIAPKILVKVILLCEILQLTERQAQSWIYLLRSSADINSKLDDRTIGRAYSNFEVLYLLKQIFELTKDSDEILSGDGSGLETTRKQNYETDRKTGEYFTSIVDSREIVQAFEMDKGEKSCMKQMIENVKGKSLRLDAGFVDRELTKKISELGMKPFIFPKKCIDINNGLAWKAMYLELFYNTQDWLKEYHQRSHCESFHSSFKRKNKPILKNNPLSRLSQLTARIIVHNLRKLNYYNQF